MKIVTVTTNQSGNILPVVFNSDDVISVNLISETKYHKDCDIDVDESLFLYCSFGLTIKIHHHKGYTKRKQFFVYGNIEKMGDTLMNGGTLPSTKNEYDKIMKTNYYSV